MGGTDSGDTIKTQANIILCMGTRPEIIKLAPLYHALKEAGAKPGVWHMGQHEEMAWPIYSFFGIDPDYRAPLVRRKQSLGHLSSILLDALDDKLNKERVSCMVVQGDTSTAFCAALSAFYRQIPVAHVEAGLRTFNRYDPFPEEKNREMIARLASWHFAPTENAKHHLLSEAIAEDAINVVGNTVVDATIEGVRQIRAGNTIGSDTPEFPKEKYASLRKTHRLVVVTAHRRENWTNGISQIAHAIRKILSQHEDIFVVWPSHLNPLVRDQIQEGLGELPAAISKRLILTQPVNYATMLHLLNDAWLLMSDSGGIQEEAITLGKPVLVLRETTERPEVIEAGGGILTGTDPDVLVKWIKTLTTDKAGYLAMQNCENPYGDGLAAYRIAEMLLENINGKK